MPKLHHFAAVMAALVLLVFAAQAAAAPVTVNVRVEGTTQTIFEAPVTTGIREVALNTGVDGGDGTGPHDCDGTSANGAANANPAPTQTGALDDAIRGAGLGWFGAWDEFNSGFLDFFIHRIGSSSDSGSTYWFLARNWTGLQTGGCQQQVQAGDDLLFALQGSDAHPFTNFPLLQLSGTPARAAVGEKFTVHVVEHDGNGSPATPSSGASVGGSTTGSEGNAVVSFDSSGQKPLKATKPDTIRSNGQTVCIYTPGSGECGTEKASGGGDQPPADGTMTPDGTPVATKDTIAPVVHVVSPVAGKKYARGPRELEGMIDEAGGIAQVFLRLSETSGAPVGSSARRCRWFSGKRGVFTHRRVPCSKARFFRIGSDAKWNYLLPERLRHGRYVLEVKVLDKAYNAGRETVPFGVK